MVKSGLSHRRILELHQQYGDVVRVAPNELSFSDPNAWNDIMGHRKKGQGENGKDSVFWERQPHAIIGADRENHTKIRRVLAHGFSNQAMVDQQPLIGHYVDLLIERLREKSKNGTEPLNMVSWYNWTTFDIIGDLVFGESFGCLDSSSYHYWVKFIFEAVWINTIMAELRRFTVGRFCLQWFMPKTMEERSWRHKRLTEEKVAQRLRLGVERPDFMEAMSPEKGDPVSD
jgi:cytochrome P450